MAERQGGRATTDSPATPPDRGGELGWEPAGDGFRTSVVRRDGYRIVVRSGALEDLGGLMRPLMEDLDARSAIVITDHNVAELHLQPALEALEAHGISATTVSIPAGERSKTVERLRELWRDLRARRAERRTVLVALGGGVLCDLVGMAAATYMRGLPYVNVPTSLMAQVDAAIGGKVAVDDTHAKNLFGAFHHPSLVVVDPTTLATLPPPEVANGFAEVVKVAVISSERLMADLEREDRHDAEGIVAIVRQAIEIKLELLANDPFEVDLRRLLNLGHCVGHPLEAASEYTMRHGQAVAIGLGVAAQVALQRGICPAETQRRIVELLGEVGLSTSFPLGLADTVWERMRVVQQVRNGTLNLVVPQTIGSCEILESIDEPEYRAAVEACGRR